jgi:hypothetical protein
MQMQGPSSIEIIVFVAIAVIFMGVTFRYYPHAEGKMTISRKVWIGTI